MSANLLINIAQRLALKKTLGQFGKSVKLED